MIFPCLACLALLTATAVPAVANDVETCSCEEVSNVRLDNSKSRVYSTDGEGDVVDINSGLPVAAALRHSIWFEVYFPSNLQFTNDDGTDDEFIFVGIVAGEVSVDLVDSQMAFSNSDTLLCEDVSIGATSVQIDFELEYDDYEVPLEITSFEYMVFVVDDAELGAAYFAVSWDYLTRVNADNVADVVTSVQAIGDISYVNVLSLPSPAPDGVSIVREIVEILVSGITQLGAGIGGGVNAFAQALAFDVSGEALSVFMVFVVVFAGLALAVGLTRLIFGWLQNLGGH